MSPELISNIVNSILEVFPENWEETKIRININDGYFGMYFFVKENKNWIHCYDLPKLFDVNEDEIDDLIEDISELFLDDTKKEWISTTIHCLNNGKITIKYEYGERMSFDEWKKENIN